MSSVYDIWFSGSFANRTKGRRAPFEPPTFRNSCFPYFVRYDLIRSFCFSCINQKLRVSVGLFLTFRSCWVRVCACMSVCVSACACMCVCVWVHVRIHERESKYSFLNVSFIAFRQNWSKAYSGNCSMNYFAGAPRRLKFELFLLQGCFCSRSCKVELTVLKQVRFMRLRGAF